MFHRTVFVDLIEVMIVQVFGLRVQSGKGNVACDLAGVVFDRHNA
ncbi:hypothetical protein [Pseudomonas avellanae]|nr:hypothetical protein [Pseudomonas avellanae]